MAVGGLALCGAFPKVLYWNTSPSMREGLWFVAPYAHVTVGDVVAACVPERSAQWARKHAVLRDGQCPGGVDPILKRVVALEGDRVQISRLGIVVNGKRIPQTEQNPTLDTGKDCGRNGPVPTTALDRILHAGEVVLVGDARHRSWDSRYIGPITDVVAVLI